MSDAIVSLIRTLVPVVVGLILAALLKVGINVDEGALSTVIDGLLVGLYYAIARALESRWPAAGWLLGAARAPHYEAKGA